MKAVDDPPGARRHIVATLYIPQQEDPFPGHQHIIENHQGVHFFEPRPQRMVESGTTVVKTLPANIAETRRVAGDGKGNGVLVGVCRRLVGTGRIDRDFVRNGAKGSQHPRATNYDPGIRFLDHPQGNILSQGVGNIPLGSAGTLRVDQGMGQTQVFFPYKLAVAAHILAESGTVFIEKRSCRRHRYKSGVKVIRGAAHHATVEPGPMVKHTPPAFEVGYVLGHNERQTDLLARSGRSKGHFRF